MNETEQQFSPDFAAILKVLSNKSEGLEVPHFTREKEGEVGSQEIWDWIEHAKQKIF